MRRLVTTLLVLFAATGWIYAGTMSIAWDPVSDSDLAGYKVYYGTAPGNYPLSKDVGNTTSTVLTGLDPCTRYYVAVKAYDTGGLESASYSNEIAGLPRPVLNTVTPSSGDQGAALTLTLGGESYDAGATVEFSGTGITVLATRRDSCSQLSVDIQIAAGAATGARDVTVLNADRSYGTKTGGFTVNTNAAPTVSSTTPAAGATNVAVTVKPTVTFSEKMDPATVTASTVRLIDSTGAAMAQAAGSPSLSADGLTATITPAANLGFVKTYRVNVIGGASGVKDITGKTMASDYTQSPGFTTAAAPDTTAPTVSSTNPADGATNVLITVEAAGRLQRGDGGGDDHDQHGAAARLDRCLGRAGGGLAGPLGRRPHRDDHPRRVAQGTGDLQDPGRRRQLRREGQGGQRAREHLHAGDRLHDREPAAEGADQQPPLGHEVGGGARDGRRDGRGANRRPPSPR